MQLRNHNLQNSFKMGNMDHSIFTLQPALQENFRHSAGTASAGIISLSSWQNFETLKCKLQRRRKQNIIRVFKSALHSKGTAKKMEYPNIWLSSLDTGIWF